MSGVFELGILAIMQKHSFENDNEKIKESQRFPPAKTKILPGFLSSKGLLSETCTAKMFAEGIEFRPPERQSTLIKGAFFYLYR